MARKDARLFIGEDQLDVYPADKMRLAVSYSIADITKIETRSSGITKTITVPGTANNRRILGFAEDINSVGGLDQTQKPAARIEVNGMDILTGVAKIIEPITDGKKNVVEYKILLVGDNGDWKNLIKGLNLRDIDFSDQNHTWDKATIDASETVVANRHYVYPVIGHGLVEQKIKFEVASMLFAIGTSTDVAFDVSVDLSWVVPGMWADFSGDPVAEHNGTFQITGVNDTIDKIQITIPAITNSSFNSFGVDTVMVIRRKGNWGVPDRYPAINVAEIIRRIYRDVGYKIVSDFFDSTFFQALYIPFGNESFKHPEAIVTNEQFRAGLSVDFVMTAVFGFVPFDVDGTGEFFDNGGNFDTVGSKYTVANSTQQEIIFGFNYKSGGTNPNDFAFDIMLNGIVLQRFRFDETDNVFTAGSISTGLRDFQAGDEVQIRIVRANNVPTFDKDNTRLYNVVSDKLVAGSPVIMNENLPDMIQIDLIKGVRQLFELYFKTDSNSRTVFIEPRDEFYFTEAEDWTDKLAVDQPHSIKYFGSELQKVIRYQYKEDPNDGQMAALNENKLIPIGSEEVEIANAFAKDGTGINENQVFSPTVMANYLFAGFVFSQIPRLWRDVEGIPNRSTDFAPRILFYDGVRSMQAGESWIWEGATRTDYPAFFSYDDLNNNDNSLMFDDRLRSNGLFQKHKRNLHKTLDDGRMLDGKFFLTDDDIDRLDFRSPKRIDINGEPVFFRLNKVFGYSPASDKLTRVQLVKLVDGVAISAVSTTSAQPPVEDPPPSFRNMLIGQDRDGNITLRTSQQEQQNESESFNTLLLGVGLLGARPSQVIIGLFNELDRDAQFILGGGDLGNPKNLIKVDKDGNLIVGGQQLFVNVSGINTPVLYTDSNNDLQEMKI